MLMTSQGHFGSFFNKPQQISNVQHFRHYAHLVRRYSVAHTVAAYLPVPTSKPNDATTLSQSNPLVLSQRTYPIRMSFNMGRAVA
jgi:hypothetical protein